MTSRHQSILLVEDSPEDYETIARAFRRAGLANSQLHCADGDSAFDLLYQRGASEVPAEAPHPVVILPDLTLPGTDGRDVLAELKRDETLRWSLVIVLTMLADPRDINACYQAGANSYVHKPVSLAGLMKAIQRLKDFWFEVVIWPEGGQAL
jgi:CheY-like chemotaxis protein